MASLQIFIIKSFDSCDNEDIEVFCVSQFGISKNFFTEMIKKKLEQIVISGN
jgi:hypothetical protein